MFCMYRYLNKNNTTVIMLKTKLTIFTDFILVKIHFLFFHLHFNNPFLLIQGIIIYENYIHFGINVFFNKCCISCDNEYSFKLLHSDLYTSYHVPVDNTVLINVPTMNFLMKFKSMLCFKDKSLFFSIPKLLYELFRKKIIYQFEINYITRLCHDIIFLLLKKYNMSGLYLQVIIYINIVYYGLFLSSTLIRFSSIFLLENIIYCFVIDHNALTLFDIHAYLIFNLLDLNLFAILSGNFVMVVNELMYVAIEDYISCIAIIMNHNPYVYYTMFNKYNAIQDSDVPLRFENTGISIFLYDLVEISYHMFHPFLYYCMLRDRFRSR